MQKPRFLISPAKLERMDAQNAGLIGLRERIARMSRAERSEFEASLYGTGVVMRRHLGFHIVGIASSVVGVLTILVDAFARHDVAALVAGVMMVPVTWLVFDAYVNLSYAYHSVECQLKAVQSPPEPSRFDDL